MKLSDYAKRNGIVYERIDGAPIIIDFMSVCHGPALYDIARTFFLLRQWNYSMANAYLKKMNVFEMDIAKYIRVIEQCREYEG